MEQDKELSDVNGIPLRAEEIGFAPDDLVACAKCARRNPPNRLKCVYCGGELELTAAQERNVAPVLRELEPWENGFNVVVRGDAASANGDYPFAPLARDILTRLLEACVALPVARAETRREAEIVADRFRERGLPAEVVADADLAPDEPPVRLRGLEFGENELTLVAFNNDEVQRIAPADVTAIVTGAFVEKHVESTEKRKKGETKVIDSSETASDERLIDFYTESNPRGWRILTKGFDFSCLGADKALLARENIGRLAGKLREASPGARFVDDYMSLRALLGEVWPVELRKDSKGLTRQRFGKFDLANVSSTSNQRQFTKYSRLRRREI